MSRAYSGTNESCDALKVESREEYCSKAPWTTFAWLNLLFCPSLFLLKCNLLTARAFFGFFLGFFTFLKFEEKAESLQDVGSRKKKYSTVFLLFATPHLHAYSAIYPDAGGDVVRYFYH